MKEIASDRRNRREQADQNGQCQESTQKKRHLVHVALLNAELAVHWALRDEELPRVTELPGHFERMTAPVTEADPVKKYGSDAHLICLGHGRIFRLRHEGSISAWLI
ncbi:hypothetical protein [Pseudomonas sp. HMWF006]|uniref:hypothetical protein n=1 Tax=Pseudomonas sp. HMWF006 TaxID=2056843 RepID=UPI0013047D1B|nr:hypothetical protein [Pseudomonas sp. HMWF006]